MTIQRKDDKSTEFGLWLRVQPEIDSLSGFRATNIDYFWYNEGGDGRWVLIEEKRHLAIVKPWQHKAFTVIDDACRKGDNNYVGFFIIRFENTNPADGKMYLDGPGYTGEITREQLIAFLREFRLPQNIF